MSYEPEKNRPYKLTILNQQFPLKSVFRISRSSKTEADVMVAIITDGKYFGWAEAVPYARYGESIATVRAQIQEVVAEGVMADSIDALVASMPAGAARNLLDCAIWDLRAKQQQRTVAELLSMQPVKPAVTAQTLSIDTPEKMAQAVQNLNGAPLVKVKLDSDNIIKKMTAIQQAAPLSKFIIDANEAWSMADLESTVHALKQLNVILIEQPLPAGKDEELLNFNSPIPLCADESCHITSDLELLKNRYQVVNIKLDKTGGLSEAVQLAKQAKHLGFDIMIGCMVGSSLAMAPVSLLSDLAQFVDLDGPLLIADDREFGLQFVNGVMHTLDTTLWGGAVNSQKLNLAELIKQKE